MTQAHAALVTVTSGRAYAAYARAMLESAETYFLTRDERTLMRLDGRQGWPDATLRRYDVLLENADRVDHATHLFMIDADMKFVAPVGREILGVLVATQHPGYVGRRGAYEERPSSTAFVEPDEGTVYFCGGFVGGERTSFLALAEAVSAGADADAARGITAVWHDESHLNRYLVDHPPAVTLTPSYCYPEDDARYLRDLWPERYEPRILALRKRSWLRRLRGRV